jgi:glutamate/tyrosine decarboxylase-like PLP-dependent enzyme
MKKPVDSRLLTWFLGPKAENAEFFTDLLMTVAQDYSHWRRNYFPGDKILTSKSHRRQQTEAFDQLEGILAEMSAGLRRNFPFYSPRYIGHQLSDVSLPALLGTFAGMLYNPNNVTPEAAPVTVEWEIEACNEILRMLGYSAPPEPPLTGGDVETYERKLRNEFGWAHITSGGTIANIESLWVARSVRYFPLAIRDAARKAKIRLLLKLPCGDQRNILSCSLQQLLLLKPNESIYLLGRFVDELRAQRGLTTEEAASEAQKYIEDSRHSPGKGFFAAAAQFPPIILASGAAHYSIQKAASVLGIGKDNVVLVDTDEMFRLNIRDLEKKIRGAVASGRIPLAVVGVAGTTEEGAVDPIHKIVNLREALEKENVSFWIHVDAAWAGFFRTLFRPSSQEKLDSVLRRIGDKLRIPFTGNLAQWHEAIIGSKPSIEEPNAQSSTDAHKVQQMYDLLGSKFNPEKPEPYFTTLLSILKRHLPDLELRKDDFKITLADRVHILQQFVSDEVAIELGSYKKEVTLMYGAEEVCRAFIAFPACDSITVDPHKMGYMGYPCGVVAFRNDRIRHFILQRAPYITAASHKVLVHHPPKHLNHNGNGGVSIDAFAPFILEGSKPGCAAAGLWLSNRVIPLSMTGHGQIVKASILAARELYEWLRHWDKICRSNGDDQDFEFVTYTRYPPDTNIVIFAVRKKNSRSLEVLNQVTKRVYDRFSIQAELGDREYSYSQPFFLSRTTFEEPNYCAESLDNFFARCDIRDARGEYKKHGAAVLRATVMNPYITPLRQQGIQNMMKEFMIELSKSASVAVRDLNG